MFKKFGELCRELGSQKVIVCLSFDCDTPEDAQAALELQKQLNHYGFKATYAVPGKELEKNAATYKKIAENGGIFVNHGMAPHAAKKDGKYIPITFYKDFNDQQINEDITKAHETIITVTGQTPKGFRTPHFGNFQMPEQRQKIRNICKKLGYSYTSDTLPARAFEYGPIFSIDDMYEIPLFSSIEEPTVLLDSYTYLEDRVNFKLSEKYLQLLKNTLDFFSHNKTPAILNFYVDPAHVISTPYFLEAIKHMKNTLVDCMTYEDLIERFGRNAQCVALQDS